MKRKIISCVLAASVMMAMGACSSEPEETEAPETTAEQTEEETEAQESEESSEETEEEAGLANITTQFFSVDYDDTVWSYDEEDLEEYSSSAELELYIPGETEDDNNVVTVDIRVSDQDCRTFRNNIWNCGFDWYEYAVNDAYDTTDIASIPCLADEDGSYLTYYGRNEDGNVSLVVSVRGETDNAEVDALLEGLTVYAATEGNVDYPWAWDGEPMNFGDLSGSVGSFNIDTHQLLMDESFVSHETFENRVAVSGDKLYILTEGILREYQIADGALTFNAEYDLGDNGFSEMQTASDGRIFISGFGANLIEWADGEVVNSWEGTNYDDLQNVAMHPSGTWGISWFVSEECKKVTLNDDGTVSTEDVVFAEADIISTLNVDDNYIFVSGSPAAEDETEHTIFVYDLDCNYVMSLRADDNGWGLGSVTYATETANGFMALDGNLRKVCFWNADGSYIGSIEDDVLFGTTYPWFCDGCEDQNGNIYVIMNEERPDCSCDEVIAYTFNGF